MLVAEFLEDLCQLFRGELVAERLRNLGVKNGVIAGHVRIVEAQQRSLDQDFLKFRARNFLRPCCRGGNKKEQSGGHSPPPEANAIHQPTSLYAPLDRLAQQHRGWEL